MAEVDKYEVRSRLLIEAMEQVGVCNPQAVIEVWMQGLIKRSAALQYSVMSEKLKATYAMQLEESAPNWVTGISSPWIDSYKIVKVQSNRRNSYVVKLEISTVTSTGPAGRYNAVLAIEKKGDFWQITKLSFDQELYVYTRFKPEMNE
jgi:hypothetical protein